MFIATEIVNENIAAPTKLSRSMLGNPAKWRVCLSRQ